MISTSPPGRRRRGHARRSAGSARVPCAAPPRRARLGNHRASPRGRRVRSPWSSARIPARTRRRSSTSSPPVRSRIRALLSRRYARYEPSCRPPPTSPRCEPRTAWAPPRTPKSPPPRSPIGSCTSVQRRRESTLNSTP